MAIELKRCIGCNACVLACKAEHFLPPDIFWNRVLIGEKGKIPSRLQIDLLGALQPVRRSQMREGLSHRGYSAEAGWNRLG
jgi:ferredoxin